MRQPLILIPLAIAELLPCLALAAAQEPAQAVRLDSQDRPAMSEQNRKDAAGIGSLPPATRTPPDFQVTTPPAELNLDSFYKKSTRVRGYPIVASENVNDYALKEAAYLIDMLTARRPDLLETMVASGSRLCILGYNEFTTDLPEFAHLKPRNHWDARARGTGGSRDDPYCSCGEENLLGYPGDPYAAECILIHEFAHNIHLRGLVTQDPTFDDRLKSAYQAAMEKGLWQGKYASVNHHEYFAEGVQSWFDNNRPPDHDHNHVDTRQELVEYDPGLAAICREVFGETELKYTKPVTRLHGHLEGYNPSDAPAFAWPERLNDAREEIRRDIQRRNGQPSQQAKIRETRVLAGWTVHVSKELLDKDAVATARALELLKAQLEEIARVVPKAAVVELQKVVLWISPEYPGKRPCAEYHPDAGWLRDHGRDPAMAKSVEFSNVRIFEAETRRMPNFALHELAHAYHDRVLAGGFANPEIKAAYERTKASGKYDRVEQRFGDGRTANVRAYALTDPQEYFAETTEAFFTRNDFYPFTRDELEQHDPEMFALLAKLWGVETEREEPNR